MFQAPLPKRLFWDRFSRSPITKAVAMILILALLVVTGRELSLSRALSDLNYDSDTRETQKPTSPAAELHESVEELKSLMELQALRDLSGEEAHLARAARSKISAQLRGLQNQFASDRKKLRELDAGEALQRLATIARKTEKQSKSMESILANVPLDGTRASAYSAESVRILGALSPSEPAQPLSTNLSFGATNAPARAASRSAGITPAYNAPQTAVETSQLPIDPSAEDLEESPEARSTLAIRSLAASLHNDPVLIYEWVLNNVRVETYYGIRKGADQTLSEQSGSPADQAALLVALLRESGIPARFLQGVVELPAETAANWLSVDLASGERLDAVPELLWSGGVPTSPIRANGQLAKVRFNHFWVEAFVAADAYRGVDEAMGVKRWTPLDVSIKEHSITPPSVDSRQLMDPVASELEQAFSEKSESQNGHSIKLPQPSDLPQPLALREKIKSALEAGGVDEDTSVAETIGGRTIRKREVNLLPNTTPFKTVAVNDESRTLADHQNASITIAVSGSDPSSPLSSPSDGGGGDTGFTFSAKTVDLANKRISLAYVPATEADEEVLDAYHGMLNARLTLPH